MVARESREVGIKMIPTYAPLNRSQPKQAFRLLRSLRASEGQGVSPFLDFRSSSFAPRARGSGQPLAV